MMQIKIYFILKNFFVNLIGAEWFMLSGFLTKKDAFDVVLQPKI